MKGSHVAYEYQDGISGWAVDGGVGWLSGWNEHADVKGEEEFLVMDSLRQVVSI